MTGRGFKIWLLLIWFNGAAYARQDTTHIYAPPDTILKRDPAFSYMKNIDSLLHVLNSQKGRARTVVFNSASDKEQGFLKIFRNPVVRIIFWLAAAVFFGYIIYTLLFKFRILDKSKRTTEATQIQEEKELRDSVYYREAAGKAESEGDYNLSVRYLFLFLLSSLQEKQMIRFVPEKTNGTYIREVSSRDIANDFRRVTRIYEYYCYGNNPLTENDYGKIRAQFENILKDITW